MPQLRQRKLSSIHQLSQLVRQAITGQATALKKKAKTASLVL